MIFDDLPLDGDLLDALYNRNFLELTPVQEQAIPLALEGHDLIACAQTGTGKTAAFLIPVMETIMRSEPSNKIRALILTPTRELAKQIDEQVEGFAYTLPVSSFPIYGGTKADNWSMQKEALTRAADIIIATPGRIISHLNMGYADFSELEFLVLDEADKMLDMGFYEDIVRIIGYLPKKRRNLLFSATMPPKIRSLAKQLMNNPKEINLAVSMPATRINQTAYLVYDDDKYKLLEHIMATREVVSMLIFGSRKTTVNQIERDLKRMKLDVKGIHSDREQSERERVLEEFKNHQFKILVATDILSRGIDVDSISHVVNFDCPPDPEDYIHRIGRTARYESSGEAITFINPKDIQSFQKIERLIGREIKKEELPEGIKSGPDYRRSSGKNQGGSKGGSKGGWKNKSKGNFQGKHKSGSKPRNS